MAGILNHSYTDIMNLHIKDGTVWNGSEFIEADVLICEGKVSAIGKDLDVPQHCNRLDASGCSVIPGLVDVHVHLREPGYGYKETISSGTLAAAHGGFTTVCAMPNLNPVPDSMRNLEAELELIRKDSVIETIPYASITKGRMGKELVDYDELAPFVAGFSDDGTGVQDDEVMRLAMRSIAKTGKLLAAHCEVDSLLRGGYIHDGKYAAANGHRGICSESEWREVERNIRLSKDTGCRLHICHISTKESVSLVREAKKEGVPVTCETGAHYLVFDDSDLQEHGRFKMNPPLRDTADREALIEGIIDGTIDCIASDHAPHSDDEKSRGLEKSAMGVTGIELSMPAVFTYLVKPGIISFKRMMDLMALNPRGIFGIAGGLQPGDRADIAIVDFNSDFRVGRDFFLSKGKFSPFEGLDLTGMVKNTVFAGKIVY